MPLYHVHLNQSCALTSRSFKPSCAPTSRPSKRSCAPTSRPSKHHVHLNSADRGVGIHLLDPPLPVRELHLRRTDRCASSSPSLKAAVICQELQGLLFASRLPFRMLMEVEERCPPRQKSRVERLKAKVEPLLTLGNSGESSGRCPPPPGVKSSI